MPFDGTDPTITEIKAAIRHARAGGRLACDRPELFSRTVALVKEHQGTTYVCALGAFYTDHFYDRHQIHYWFELAPPVVEFCHRVRDAHDALHKARRAWWPDRERVARLEQQFAALIE
jgi:hypothetical protein